ncbi:uncharacterized protein BDZ99DRAFT_163485 [Mytilinidion resinicola]|uniref:Uncharacterized protein n=1 Tax=Mytilinidion resinicola TaxID=574789 RepID=A0A6A6Y4T0_9PEZI|nr:uncharacterized protein BDZ99DRAFT_163485 [Mytilinidion resinicola]KAF2803816.1 hypothetical protein BDZ99DRAFT_163485 [Mytilinidion resinicola]
MKRTLGYVRLCQPYRTIIKVPPIWANYEPEQRRLAKLDALRELCDELRRDASVQNWFILILDDEGSMTTEYLRYRVVINKIQFMAASIAVDVDLNGHLMDERALNMHLRMIERWVSKNESEREFQYEPCDIRVEFDQVRWDQPATRIESPPDVKGFLSRNIEGHGKNATSSNTTLGRSRRNAVESRDMSEAP